MDKAKINGVELEYEVKGSGEPVLLISTGPIADSFLPFLSEKALVERYRLIRYHQRGQAGSTHGPGPVSFAEHAADAAALLGHLGIRRAHVAGHSTGAVIALQLAVDRPEIVHTLALLEPPLMGVPSAGAFFEKAGPALAAYGSGDREGAMAAFLSVVCSLDWETCRTVIEQHVPGGVAQAMKDADNCLRQLPASPQRMAVRARAGSGHLPAGAFGAGHGDRAAVRGGPRAAPLLVPAGRGLHDRGRRPPAAHAASGAGGAGRGRVLCSPPHNRQ